MSDAIALRNRFAMVKGAWDDHLRGIPFPALGEGTAEQKTATRSSSASRSITRSWPGWAIAGSDRLVAGAGEDRQAGVLRVARVRTRPQAHREGGAAGVADHLLMAAGRAEAGRGHGPRI